MNLEALQLGQEKKIGHGHIRAKKARETKSSPETKPGVVELHEAAHVFVAFATGEANPEGASSIPDGPSDGRTFLSKFSPTALAAGEALGDRGGAFGDRMIALFNGVDWNAAVARARSVIAGNMHIIRALASALAKWRELGGGDLREVYDEARNGSEMIVVYTDDKGVVREESARSKPGTQEVKIPAIVFAVLMEAAEEETNKSEKKAKKSRKRKSENQKPDIVTEADFMLSESGVRH